MYLLYAIIVQLAKIFLPVVGMFNPKIKQFLAQRKSTLQDLSNWSGERSGKPVLWLHCSSLGEYEMIVPLISEKQIRRNYEVVVSFFSASGYKHARYSEYISCKFYLLLDDRKTMKRLVSEINPKVFVLVKYDYWLNLLSALNAHGSTNILVNGIFTKRQFITSAIAGSWRNELKKFNRLYVQNKSSYNTLYNHGFANCEISKDLRYDRVIQLKGKNQIIHPILDFKAGDPLLILGSSWPEEEYIVSQYLDFSKSKLKVLIAPHDVSQEHIDNLLNQFQKYNPELFSRVTNFDNVQVLILNTIGHLSSAYQYADYAFVGGAFGKGLHNILEAAVYGLPIFTGPNIDKFPEAKMLQDLGILKPVDQDPRHFIELFEEVKDNEELLSETKLKLENWFDGRTGESTKIAEYIASLK